MYFRIQTDISRQEDVFLDQKEMTQAQIYGALAEKGVTYNPLIPPQKCSEFFMSWIQDMKDRIASHDKVPFGWIWRRRDDMKAVRAYGVREVVRRFMPD